MDETQKDELVEEIVRLANRYSGDSMLRETTKALREELSEKPAEVLSAMRDEWAAKVAAKNGQAA